MIKTERIAKPLVLADNAGKWTDEYVAAREALSIAVTAEQKRLATKAKDAAERKYNHAQVRSVLRTMFYGGKCAYCESHISHISYPQIEHYKPKDNFPKLCFEWDNLLLGCGVCNGKEYKGTKFPMASDGGFLINPCEDDPEDFFDFVCEPDENSEEGFIAVVRPKKSRGEITEHTLGLNRIPLLRKRTQTLVPYYLSLAQLAGEGDEKSKDILQRFCHPRFEYSAFAKWLWRKFVDKTL